MGGIKYYQLSKGEEMPDEFCAVRDIGGEPSEYVFYVPEAENAKLRELLAEMYPCAKAYLQEWLVVGGIDSKIYDWHLRLRELGIEVGE